MRIDELTLKNFKKFENQQLRFTPSFNLLVGENGSGKTSILDGLAVAIGSWELGLARYNRLCSARSILHKEVRLAASLSNVGRVRSKVHYERRYPVSVTARGMAYSEKKKASLLDGDVIEWTRTLESARGRTTSKAAKAISELGRQVGMQVMNGEAVTLPLISYYGTGRVWYQPRDLKSRMKLKNSKLHRSRLEGYRYSYFPFYNAVGIFDWFQEEQYISLQEGAETAALKTVKQAVLNCVDGAVALDFNVMQADLILSVADQEPQPFNNLSDGYRSMVAMVSDIALKCHQLNGHLGMKALRETPGVVLIDELDLHLHPKWQRRIVEDLRRTFPRIQFICTTHSPFIIQTARPDEVISLDGQVVPNLGKLGIENIAEGIMGVDNLEVSPRYLQMKEAAKKYLLTVDEASRSPRQKLAAYEKRLSEGIGPFADNPAFQAFLELKRAAKLGVRKDQNGH